LLGLVDVFVAHVHGSQKFEGFAHLGAVFPVHFFFDFLDFLHLLDALFEFLSLEECHHNCAFGGESFAIGVPVEFLQGIVAVAEGLDFFVELPLGLVVGAEGLVHVGDFFFVVVVDADEDI
jgi:hypothetical protein